MILNNTVPFILVFLIITHFVNRQQPFISGNLRTTPGMGSGKCNCQVFAASDCSTATTRKMQPYQCCLVHRCQEPFFFGRLIVNRKTISKGKKCRDCFLFQFWSTQIWGKALFCMSLSLEYQARSRYLKIKAYIPKHTHAFHWIIKDEKKDMMLWWALHGDPFNSEEKGVSIKPQAPAKSSCYRAVWRTCT